MPLVGVKVLGGLADQIETRLQYDMDNWMVSTSSFSVLAPKVVQSVFMLISFAKWNMFQYMLLFLTVLIYLLTVIEHMLCVKIIWFPRYRLCLFNHKKYCFFLLFLGGFGLLSFFSYKIKLYCCRTLAFVLFDGLPGFRATNTITC